MHNNNYLHLDCKGIIPLHPKILQWLEFIASFGYDGVIWEYEDRYPWKTFPYTSREVYSESQWRTIWEKCFELGLEVIPLAQTHGHLEWLLKHERYAGWRENGCWNEICPQNDDAVSTVLKWIDEVCLLHPDSRFIHIGGDETWNLGTCPKCLEESKKLGGKLQVYLRHLTSVCEYVISKGKRPIIWGDVFYRSETPELAAELPRETVLVDWQYTGRAPWASTDKLLATKHEVWGASASACSYDLTNIIYPVVERINNIREWKKTRGEVEGMINTTWGRGRSLLPLYGPWHSALPGFIAGGTNSAKLQDSVSKWGLKIDAALCVPDYPVQQLLDDLVSETPAEPLIGELFEWWRISLRYQKIKDEVVARALSYAQLEQVNSALKVEPDYVNHSRRGQRAVAEKLDVWNRELRGFFEQHQLSDTDEFAATKTAPLRKLLNIDDWAVDIIERAEPISKR